MKRLIVILMLFCSAVVSAQELPHTGIEEIDKEIDFFHISEMFGNNTGNQAQRIIHLSEILSMMEDRGLDNDVYYQLLHERAKLYFQVERYHKSLDDCIRVFNHYQSTNDTSNLVKICAHLTQISRMQEDAQHEIYYAEQCYQYALHANDKSVIIAALTTLRDAYYYANPSDETDALCADVCRRLDDMLEENDANAASIIENLCRLNDVGGIGEQETLERIVSLLEITDNEIVKSKYWRLLASYYYERDDKSKAIDYYHKIIDCFNERYDRIKEKEKANGGVYIDGTLAGIFTYYADAIIMLTALSFMDGDYEQSDIYIKKIRSFFEGEVDLTTSQIRRSEISRKYYRNALHYHLTVFIHKYNRNIVFYNESDTETAHGPEWMFNPEVCETIHKYCQELNDYYSILQRQLPYMTKDERGWYIDGYYQHTTPLIELLSLYSQDSCHEEEKLVSNTLFAIVSYLKGLLLHMESYGDMGIDDESSTEDSRTLTLDTQLMFNQKGNNSAVIEYIDYYDEFNELKKYVALFIRKGWDAPKMVELCDELELEQIYKQQYRAYSEELAKKLYDMIWAKLEPYINEGDEVYFSPAGLLHQMNIEVVQDGNGRLANEKYNLHRVSSTRELCTVRPEIERTSAVLYGGLEYNMDSEAMLAQSRAYSRTDDYLATRGFDADSLSRGNWGKLPNSETEIATIGEYMKLHGIDYTSYTAQAGTEESFKALSGKRTPIIHLATHGFFFTNEQAKKRSFFDMLDMDNAAARPDNSLKRSGLIMAGAQRAWNGEPIPDSVEDGILLAEEIAAMDLSGTDLVVLSACQTGLGEITSEGVFGLQRAFKKAGVQTLIMSLWSVQDNVAPLMMQTFYREWLSGKSKHEAFAIAQQTVRAKHPDPYYWASFIMLD